MTNDRSATRGSILVTGGSRGIGAATSLLCARRGWAVAVNYTRDVSAAEAVVAAIVAAGGQAVAVRADVASEAEVAAMFLEIDRSLPPLAGLVNNAGVVDLPGRVDATSTERLQRMFAINVFGSFFCAREATLRMTTKPADAARARAGNHRGGAIVNLSSAAAKLGGAGQYVDYAAAKGAIDSFTLGWRRSWRQKAFASTPSAPASSRPTSMPRAARPTGPGRWRRRCHCNAPGRLRKWPRPSSGCSRMRPATPPARSSR